MAEAAAAAGSTLKAIGAIRQGNMDANMAQYNATVAEQDAQTTLAQGDELARRSLVNSRKILGNQAASYGASGVTSDGSAMDVMRSTAAQGELNALTIKNNASIKAQSYRNEAALNQYRASNMRTSGYMGAAASLLSGASKASSMGGSSGAAADVGDM